jgi:hypothetical protein
MTLESPLIEIRWPERQVQKNNNAAVTSGIVFEEWKQAAKIRRATNIRELMF